MLIEAVGTLIEASLATSAAIVLVLTMRRSIARHLGAYAAYSIWLLVPISFVVPIVSSLLPHVTGDPDLLLWSGVTGSMINTGVFPGLTATEQIETGLVGRARPPFLFVAWIVVGTIWFCRNSFGQLSFQKRAYATSRAYSAGLGALHYDVCQKLGLTAPPILRVSGIADGPFVIGFRRPVVFVPLNFETQYSEDEQRLMLAHEALHIKRKDLWWRFCALLYQTLQWFNPLAHFSYRAFCSDQEAACDADVIRSMPHQHNASYHYGLVLAKTVRVAPLRPSARLALFFATSLKERLSVLRHRSGKSLTAAPAHILVALIATCAGLSIAAWREPPSKSAPVLSSFGASELPAFLSSQAAADDREMFIVEINETEGGKQQIVVLDVGDVEHIGGLQFSREDISGIIECNGSAPPGHPVDVLIGRIGYAPFVTPAKIVCLTGNQAGALEYRVGGIIRLIAGLEPNHPVLPKLRRQIMPDS